MAYRVTLPIIRIRIRNMTFTVKHVGPIHKGYRIVTFRDGATIRYRADSLEVEPYGRQATITHSTAAAHSG